MSGLYLVQSSFSSHLDYFQQLKHDVWNILYLRLTRANKYFGLYKIVIQFVSSAQIHFKFIQVMYFDIKSTIRKDCKQNKIWSKVTVNKSCPNTKDWSWKMLFKKEYRCKPFCCWIKTFGMLQERLKRVWCHHSSNWYLSPFKKRDNHG